MNKKIIFLGPLYQRNKEKEIKQAVITGISDAPNVFQWNLINGLSFHLKENFTVINVLPIGTWPLNYKKLILPTEKWNINGINGTELGCLNLPIIKQHERYKKLKRLLKKIDSDIEFILYSPYLPFLKAIYNSKLNVKVTVIMTDLPEYSYLTKRTNFFKKIIGMKNKKIYNYLNKVDRFIVLTKKMYNPLHIENRPWLCIEGICNDNKIAFKKQKSNEKFIILYTGSLSYIYGIKNLLEAFESLSKQNYELWICGSGEAEKDLHQKYDNVNNIKYFGFCTQDEIRNFQEEASVLINPRQNIGEYTKYSFPSKTMEYMLTGKPVIMYKLDGIPDEYDEYLFYITEKLEPKIAIKEKIFEICENYDVALEKSNNARNFVLKEKNSIVQSRKILEFIENN